MGQTPNRNVKTVSIGGEDDEKECRIPDGWSGCWTIYVDNGVWK